MDKLKISTRLSLVLGFLAFLLLVIGALGIYGLSHTHASLKTVYEDRTVTLQQLGDINYRVQRNRVLLSDMLRDQANAQAQNKEVHDNLELIQKNWKDYLATYLTPEEVLLAKDFDLALKRYLDEGFLAALQALTSGHADAATTLYNEKVQVLGSAERESLTKLIQLQVDVAKQEYEKSESVYSTLRWIVISAIVAGIAFALLASVAVTRSITRQLGTEPHEAARLAECVAAGDLSTPIELKPGDNTSVMAQFKKMRDSLIELVSHVRQGSESVATASAEIAQGNQDLSNRTENQAAALEQTAASMEELSSTVKQNADNAHQGNQLAMNASNVAVQGGEVVAQVVETMKGINEASRKIADIISVIDGIAFQTNILALNAAVEAARAGEQGRGFAVVASEVRSLAGRSAEAAKEIKVLINDSVSRVEQGTMLVDEAGSTMHEVVTAIKRVTDIMGEISAASGEQSQGVSQVGEAVTQMDQATQQNAALVEEMAAAASSLKAQAQELVQTVAVFKLGANDRSSARPLPTAAVRAHPPKPVAFKGADRRAGGVPKGAAARSASSASATQAKNRPMPLAAPATTSVPTPASGTSDSDWESF